MSITLRPFNCMWFVDKFISMGPKKFFRRDRTDSLLLLCIWHMYLHII